MAKASKKLTAISKSVGISTATSTTIGTATGTAKSKSVTNSHGTTVTEGSYESSNASHAEELSLQMAFAKSVIVDNTVYRVHMGGNKSAVYAVCIVPMGEDVPVLSFVYDKEETARGAQQVLESIFAVGKAVVLPRT